MTAEGADEAEAIEGMEAVFQREPVRRGRRL